MEIISVVIQCFIGLMFAIYGIWSLLSNRKKGEQAKEKFVLLLVCILAGIFLLGYVAYQVYNFPIFREVERAKIGILMREWNRMIAIDFGNLCFNVGTSEQNILVVAAPKHTFSSLDDFITAALKFLESDERFYDNWTELYKNRTNLPASDDDLAWMKSRLEEMNRRINLLWEPAIQAVNVIPPKWNDITLGLETINEYILYLWSTSA